MTRVLKSGISFGYGHGRILERPKLAALIGAITSEWAYVEDRMLATYAYIMGISLPRIPGWEAPLHPVGRQVFHLAENNQRRLRLLKELADWYVPDEQLKQSLKGEVFDILKKALARRNTVAHAVWAVADAHPDELVLTPPFGECLLYSERDFEEVREAIRSAGEALVQWEMKLRGVTGG